MRILKKIYRRIVPLAIQKKLMNKDYGRFMFSRFDEVQFDEDGWRYAVPEKIATEIADKFTGQNILEPFAGIGSTAIQFALSGNKVTAIEKNPRRFRFLQHNARVYNAHVQAINADCYEYLEKNPGSWDVVFLDPPWDEFVLDENFARHFLKYAPKVLLKTPGKDGGLQIETLV